LIQAKTNFEKVKSETKQKVNDLQLKERNRFLTFLYGKKTKHKQTQCININKTKQNKTNKHKQNKKPYKHKQYQNI